MADDKAPEAPAEDTAPAVDKAPAPKPKKKAKAKPAYTVGDYVGVDRQYRNAASHLNAPLVDPDA